MNDPLSLILQPPHSLHAVRTHDSSSIILIFLFLFFSEPAVTSSFRHVVFGLFFSWRALRTREGRGAKKTQGNDRTFVTSICLFSLVVKTMFFFFFNLLKVDMILSFFQGPKILSAMPFVSLSPVGPSILRGTGRERKEEGKKRSVVHPSAHFETFLRVVSWPAKIFLYNTLIPFSLRLQYAFKIRKKRAKRGVWADACRIYSHAKQNQNQVCLVAPHRGRTIYLREEDGWWEDRAPLFLFALFTLGSKGPSQKMTYALPMAEEGHVHTLQVITTWSTHLSNESHLREFSLSLSPRISLFSPQSSFSPFPDVVAGERQRGG